MPSIRKVLVTVDFPNPSFPVIHQAAMLAHRFHAGIVLLHVASLLSYDAGVPEHEPELSRWDMLAAVLSDAQNSKDTSLAPELQGLSIQTVVSKGGAAKQIVATAQQNGADVIMMPCGGHLFDEFLLGSAVEKVPQTNESPVWTAGCLSQDPAKKFAIARILCAVHFDPRDRRTVPWAEYLAQEFGAALTLAHVTPSVDFWGPGGTYVDVKWKNAILTDANRRMAALQKTMTMKSHAFIGSGHGPSVLANAASQTKADLLITGCRPYGGNLRTHGYGIISAVSVPVLSV